VVKAEWGTKRICQECGTKVYDMRRAEIICPKCEAAFQIVPPKAKRGQPAAKEPVAEAKPAAVVKEIVPGSGESDDADEIDKIEAVVTEGDDDDDDDDEDMIEDTSDLGDDDDDLAEVIQKPPAPDES
jgi:uncharacterized protein (TIGR02300 family)